MFEIMIYFILLLVPVLFAGPRQISYESKGTITDINMWKADFISNSETKHGGIRKHSGASFSVPLGARSSKTRSGD